MNFSQLIKFSDESVKHSELSAQIRTLILEGVLIVGSRLPTEEKLAFEIGVSKSIIRQTYHTLIKEGWIKRIPKQGVIVQNRKTSHTFSTKLQSIGDDMVSMGLTPSVNFLGSELVNNVDIGIEYFSPTESLLKVERIILGSGIPLLVMQSYYSIDRYPFLKNLDINVISFFRVFEDELKVSIHKTFRYLRPEKMQKVYADQLKVNVDSPCSRVVSVTLDNKEQCIEYAISYAVGDRFLISL